MGSGVLVGVLVLLAVVGLAQRASGTEAEASAGCEAATAVIERFEAAMTARIADHAPAAALVQTTEAFVSSVSASRLGSCAYVQTHVAAAAASLGPICPACTAALMAARAGDSGTAGGLGGA